MKQHLLTTIILALLLIPSALAQIDLISPAQNALNNGEEVSFDYYNGLENPISCTLNIPPQTLPDVTVQNGINSFIVQNIDAGTYTWSVTCQNSTDTQTSTTRTLTIDTTPPEIQLTKPDLPDDQLTVRLLVTDTQSNELTCTVKNDGTTIDTLTVTEGTYSEKDYTMTTGSHTLNITCADEAGNTKTITRNYEVTINDYLTLQTDQETYGLGETILLSIDAPTDANMTIDICPNEAGFVQCVSPLILPGFPQTVQLPTNNKTGSFLVEGIMITPRGTLINSTTYQIENTIGINLETNNPPRLSESFLLTAEVLGAIGDITYTWELHNGTTYETTNNRIEIQPTTPGTKTDTVTVTDEAGNQKVDSITYTVSEDKLVTIRVRDTNNNPLSDVLVQIDDTENTYTTNTQGTVQIRLEFGTNKLYAGKTGYKTFFENREVTATTNEIIITLTKETANGTITVNEPANQASFTTTDTIALKFTTQGFIGGTCSLYMALSTENFLEQKGTIDITADGQTGFALKELDPGQHAYSVECSLGTKILSTQKRYFTITPATTTQPTPQQNTQPTTQPTTYTDNPDAEFLLFEQALESLRAQGTKEQELIAYLDLEQQVREAKRQAGQLNRDIFDLKYRTDLSEGEINAERQRMQTELNQLTQQTPISIEILDQKTIVTYITEEEINALLEEHATTLDVPAKAADILAEAQQRYTMKTKLYRAQIKYGDGKQTPISVVTKTLAYGQEKAERGADNEYLIEVIPKTIAATASQLNILTENSEVLLDDPILKFPATNTIVYYVEKDLALTELENVRTILVPDIQVMNNGITGFALFGEGELQGIADNMGISLAFLLAILVAAYLAYYFSLIDKVKYLFYAGGPKTKVHYVRVLLNDVHDNLVANNYDKALMIYKEIKLTYDQLSIPEKNELFEEITMVCAELDQSYMKRLVLEMDTALKTDQLEEAINYYAKIEATYERLPSEQQQQVREIVTGLAKRLGVAA